MAQAQKINSDVTGPLRFGLPYRAERIWPSHSRDGRAAGDQDVEHRQQSGMHLGIGPPPGTSGAAGIDRPLAFPPQDRARPMYPLGCRVGADFAGPAAALGGGQPRSRIEKSSGPKNWRT
jgi:hypothetical protein